MDCLFSAVGLLSPCPKLHQLAVNAYADIAGLPDLGSGGLSWVGLVGTVMGIGGLCHSLVRFPGFPHLLQFEPWRGHVGVSCRFGFGGLGRFGGFG